MNTFFLLTKSPKYYYDHEAIKEPASYDGRKDTVMKGSTKYKESVVPGKKKHTMASNGYERWNKNENSEYVRNKRSVWTVNTKPNKDDHFAVFPPNLIKPCVLAGCPKSGIVLDPFVGNGTTYIVSRKMDRNCIGFDLSGKYIEGANKRIYRELGMFR